MPPNSKRRIQRYGIAGKTVTLKIKYSDFTLQTRSKTLPYYISDKSLMLETARELLYQEKMKESVRLLGLSLTNLNTEEKKNHGRAAKIRVLIGSAKVKDGQNVN